MAGPYERNGSRQGAKAPRNEEPSEEDDRIAALVVDACLKIHVALGPGLLESVYERVLAHELKQRGCSVQVQVPVKVDPMSRTVSP